MPVTLNLWTTVSVLNVDDLPNIQKFALEHSIYHSYAYLKTPFELSVDNTDARARDAYIESTNSNNNDLVKLNDDIKDQNDKLSAKNLNSDVVQQMVNYTYEKNRYSSNLLALYGGLNIVAIALLLYIYRA
jgi:carboxypeptidase C (cathepsin A)